MNRRSISFETCPPPSYLAAKEAQRVLANAIEISREFPPRPVAVRRDTF